MNICNRKSGFTLPEALLTMALLGILTTITFPRVHGVLDKCKEKQAIAKAETLNSAKVCFKMRIADAQESYLKNGTDESRFQLLKKYIPISEVTFDQYAPKGFSIKLGKNLDEKVKLNKGNAPIKY